MIAIASPHERSRKIKTSETLEAGRRQANDLLRWMESHEDAFWKLYDYVKQLQESKTSGRIRDRVAVHVANSDIKVGDTPYKFANGYWAGIARYMALYDRTLVDNPLKFADSDLDCFGLWPVDWLDLKEEE